VLTLALWGEITPGATLTKCGVWGDMVDVITCAIFVDCRLRDVGVVRGVSLPSLIDLTRRPYNTGHTTVWPCDISVMAFVHRRSWVSRFWGGLVRARERYLKSLREYLITWGHWEADCAIDVSYSFIVFIARQCADARYWYSKSVLLSVRR